MRTSNIFVTVDAIVFRRLENKLELLLIRRKHEPFKDAWALPGGFVDQDEDLHDAAVRELEEETCVKVTKMEQLKAFGKPGRDPRHHTVSVAFTTFVDQDTIATAADDAGEVGWFEVVELPALAFDHAEIIDVALSKINT